MQYLQLNGFQSQFKLIRIINSLKLVKSKSFKTKVLPQVETNIPKIISSTSFPPLRYPPQIKTKQITTKKRHRLQLQIYFKAIMYFSQPTFLNHKTTNFKISNINSTLRIKFSSNHKMTRTVMQLSILVVLIFKQTMRRTFKSQGD